MTLHLAVFGATSRGETTMECSCGAIDPEECAQATPEDPKEAKRSSLAGGAGGDHVRSYDPDGKPLHYCATCYQDWPCQPVQALRTVLADETGEQP